MSEEMKREAERVKSAYAVRAAHDPRYAADNWAHVRMIAEVESRFREALAQYARKPLSEATLFEVGCGAGSWLARAIGWGFRPESVAGIELLPERVGSARASLPAATRVFEGSATAIPLPAGTCDVVLQATLFSSVHSPAIERAIAAEMRRILSPSGVILWYDMRVRNPWNRDVHPLGKSRVRELFPDCEIEFEPVILIPQLARRLSRFPWLTLMLWRVPWLRSHYVATIRPRPAARA